MKGYSPWVYNHRNSKRVKPMTHNRMVVVDGGGEFRNGSSFGYDETVLAAQSRCWPEGMVFLNRAKNREYIYEKGKLRRK